MSTSYKFFLSSFFYLKYLALGKNTKFHLNYLYLLKTSNIRTKLKNSIQI